MNLINNCLNPDRTDGYDEETTVTLLANEEAAFSSLAADANSNYWKNNEVIKLLLIGPQFHTKSNPLIIKSYRELVERCVSIKPVRIF